MTATDARPDADDRPTETRIDRTDAASPRGFDGRPSVAAGRPDRATDDPAVALTPSSRVFETAEATDAVSILRLRLANRSSTVVAFDPDAWRLYRRDADAWVRLPRDSSGGSPVGLGPGETHDYHLATVPHPTPRASDRTAVVVDLRSGAVDGFPVAGTLAPDGDPVDVASLARLRHVRATP